MATAGTGLNLGIQECSKCEYKLRCEECANNKKDMQKFASEVRKETADEIYDFVKEYYSSNEDVFGERLKEFIKRYGVEVE